MHISISSDQSKTYTTKPSFDTIEHSCTVKSDKKKKIEIVRAYEMKMVGTAETSGIVWFRRGNQFYFTTKKKCVAAISIDKTYFVGN